MANKMFWFGLSVVLLFGTTVLVCDYNSGSSGNEPNIPPNIPDSNFIHENNLPPLLFPNIQAANRYINENLNSNDIDYLLMLETLHERFLGSEYGSTMGYNWFSGIILADLDRDGTYELYLNASLGSFYIHAFIHGYNPVSEKYYIISRRLESDYILFIYRNNLYVLAQAWPEIDWTQTSPTIIDMPEYEGFIKIYIPKLLNEILVLEEIEESMEREIMGTISLRDVYYPFGFDLVGDNFYRENHGQPGR